jgi:hypothetical protein
MAWPEFASKFPDGTGSTSPIHRSRSKSKTDGSRRGGLIVDRRSLSLATWCLLILTVRLYVASFFLPAYREPESGSGTGPQRYRIDPGHVAFVSALIFGWPAWWANPAYWLAVALLVARRRRAALPLAIIALLLAISAIPLATVFRISELYRLMAGYWTWSAAIGALVLICIKDRRDERRFVRRTCVMIAPDRDKILPLALHVVALLVWTSDCNIFSFAERTRTE